MKLIVETDQKIIDECKKLFSEGYSNDAEYAIATGTPVSTEGDLISREALRKEVTEKVNFTTVDGHIAYDKMLKLIDNAQAIPLPNEQNCLGTGL